MNNVETIEGRDLPVELALSESELEARHDHITSFITDTLAAAGADGAVLGLSGGIDSTATAYVAAEAIGPENLYGLLLPSEVNPEADTTDAERVARDLGIEYEIVEIEPLVDAFLDVYPGDFDESAVETEPLRTAVGNIRVRVRGVLNYFVANTENRLVLGTGNRSETLTGYFTKYGDQAVDCNPLGNLYKLQVRQLASFMEVPRDLVEREPSAGMWAGQTDEEEMGLDYDTLDYILALHVDGPFSRSATARTLGLDESVIDRVVDLYRGSAHKRQLPPAPDDPGL